MKRASGLLVWGALLLSTLWVGCATRLSALRERALVPTAVGTFDIHYSGGDELSEAQLRRALAAAAPKLERWGRLRAPVSIWVLPSHDELEAAVNREGYDWLRAWARYDEVYLQSPRSWSLDGAIQSAVDELMLHELTHCVMYQLGGTQSDWMHKQIPLWFREGMASVTAGQGYRWPGLEAVARYYAENPDKNPAAKPDDLYQRESDIVYGTAHHAFAFLAERYGDRRIRRLLDAMRAGRTFPEAFPLTIGLSPEAFLEEFERFLRLRGFKGKRLKSPHQWRTPTLPRADPGP